MKFLLFLFSLIILSSCEKEMPAPEMEYPTDSHPELVERYLGTYKGTITTYDYYSHWVGMGTPEVMSYTQVDSGVICNVERTGPVQLVFESNDINFNAAQEKPLSNIGYYNIDTAVFKVDIIYEPISNLTLRFKINYSTDSFDTLNIYESENRYSDSDAEGYIEFTEKQYVLIRQY